MFVQDRGDARRFFISVREKYKRNQPLEPIEGVILDVILAHPEYHGLLDEGEKAVSLDYSPENGSINPFLHMSMHIAIKEQIATDRPAGITAACQAVLGKSSDQHEMEHRVMECLGEALWRAQRDNGTPDESAYLEQVRLLA